MLNVSSRKADTEITSNPHNYAESGYIYEILFMKHIFDSADGTQNSSRFIGQVDHKRSGRQDHNLWCNGKSELIFLRINPEHGRCDSPIPACRTLSWFLECFPFVKLESAMQAIIGFHTYSFFLVPKGFFYECQMMANILLHDTNRLWNLPYGQGAVRKKTYDFMPDGLFSFIAHHG